MLYIVPTPIGNLGDITLRALEVLKNSDVIYAEDTRKTLTLLNHFNISKPLKSFHKDNEFNTLNSILNDIENNEISLVSDAGTPCISDPGHVLVQELVKRNISFEVLPGATAFVPALIYSGFPTKGFMFVGFLNHKKSKRKEELKYYKNINGTLIFYESVHRIKKTLKEMLEYFDTPFSVSRELTKKFEETIFIHSENDIKNITEKGEFVIVVHNKVETNNSVSMDFKELITQLTDDKFTKKDILKILKILGLKRNEAYNFIENQ